MYMDPTVRVQNENTINGLRSQSDVLRKEAKEGVDSWLRLKIREDGFGRKIFNPINVSPSDFDRQVDTPKPVIVKDMEPSSAGAYSVPFGTTPNQAYIKAPRYRVMFDRLMTQRYYADTNELLTFDMDIRQIMYDFMLKDLMAEEDRKIIAVANTIVGTKNTVNSALGACRYVEAGAMSRTSLVHAMKGMPASNRNLNPSTALINNITVWDVVGLDRTAAGGDLAQDMLLNGFAQRKMLGLNWAITIKKDLVPTNTMFQFTEPKYLGDFFILDDVTISTKNEDFMIEFFAYECLGATIQNIAAVTRVDFTGSAHSWFS